jgi:hypothetical protein
LAIWRVRGCGWCRPVKVWLRGADWMTLSLANCSWDGATMLSPGGAFLLDVPGVLGGKPPNSLSFALSIGASPGFAVCCNRDSMSCLCCSRTEMLRCNCSLIVGSCVTNPGDRHASPTSWMPSPPVSMPLEVRLPPEGREFEVDVFFERSSMRGRCLEVGRSGEAPGSFFTMIFGGAPFRDLGLPCQRGS